MTRTFTTLIATAAVAASAVIGASAASANTGYNYFTQQSSQQPTKILDVGTVRADGNASVQIVDINGKVLGETPIHSGVTVNVRVPLDQTTYTSVYGNLIVDGVVVDNQLFRVSR